MRKIINLFPRNLRAVFTICTSLLISGCDQDSIGPLKGSLEDYSSSSYDGQEFNLKRDIEFHPCEESAYYEGHGVESLKTDNLDDYLSAVNHGGSSVCFSLKTAATLNHLKIVWYSKDEVPSSIEVIGFNRGVFARKELLIWSMDQTMNLKSLNGYFYSELILESHNKFSTYMIKYVGGASQDRLILRAVTPFFRTHVPLPLADILEDVYSVSRIRPHGRGVSFTSANNPIDFVSELKNAETLHCGNFAFIFTYDTSGKYSWTVFGAKSALNGHTVVEINYMDARYVADPTLGVLYPCSYSEMTDDLCDYSKAIYTDTYNPIMWRYSAGNFFPGVNVVAAYAEMGRYFNAVPRLTENRPEQLPLGDR